jgi:hypothetical protein
MSGADRVIKWSLAVGVLGAGVASYEHAYDLVRAHGESGWRLTWFRSRGRADLREFDGDA